jgi:hypothetical protein
MVYSERGMFNDGVYNGMYNLKYNDLKALLQATTTLFSLGYKADQRKRDSEKG